MALRAVDRLQYGEWLRPGFEAWTRPDHAIIHSYITILIHTARAGSKTLVGCPNRTCCRSCRSPISTMDVDLPAGNYAFICFVPDTATGKPRAKLGMVGGFTVK